MGIASTLFHSSAEQTLINRITPTVEQREFLQVEWNALAEHLKKVLSEEHGYGISTWLQGSYKYGTLIKPVHHNEQYDVDVGIYFRWNESENTPPSPEEIRNWVQEELKIYSATNDQIKEISEPKERCSRVIYEKQFHIDTPVYHLDPENDTRRLACISNLWEDSDPKTIYQWFKDVVIEDHRDQLRRLVRYAKAWAAVSFDDALESRPSSIFLTVLIAEAYKDMLLERIWGIDDEDALIKIIEKIHERLYKKSQVKNPIDDGENLNRMSGSDWEGFLTRLDAFKEVSLRAKEATDEASAALIWSEAFSFLMPLPETDEVEIIDESSGKSVMALPEISITVYKETDGEIIAKHINEVPSVQRGYILKFEITNPHILPEYAVIEWTVRNEGSDADSKSDLGHRVMGMRLLSNTENTAYKGRHFMDCIIRSFGQVYAVRRVPVNIVDLRQLASRNPPRPAYTKIRSLRRRR